MFICKNDKTVVPTILQKFVVNWYHTYLLHPGKERTEATIRQHYSRPHLRDNIRTDIKFCNTCKKKKKQNFKYVKLPAKEAEAIPWDRLSVDIIGLYKIIREGREYLHNHVCYTKIAIVAACLSLYCTLSNHPVAGSIIVKDFSMKWSSRPSLIIL